MCQEGGGLHVSEDRGNIRRENEKRKGEGDTSFHTMGEMGGGVEPARKFAHSPHLEKSFPFHMEKFPIK